ncbi:MAG: YkgJ family cysteine cluster protein [Candidatus Kariarchaeaceae archaeon]
MRHLELGSNYKSKDYYKKLSEIEQLNNDFECYECGWCCVSYRYFSMEEYQRICEIHNLKVEDITTEPREDHVYYGLELKMNEDNSCLFMKNTHNIMDEIIAFGKKILREVENSPWNLSEKEFKVEIEKIIEKKVIEPEIRHCSIHPEKFITCMTWPTLKVNNTIVCPLGCDSTIKPLDAQKKESIEEAYYELKDLAKASGLAYHAFKIASSDKPLEDAQKLITSMNQSVGVTSYEKSKKLIEKLTIDQRINLTEAENEEALICSSKLRYVHGTDLRWVFLGYYWLALWSKLATQTERLKTDEKEELLAQIKELIDIFNLFPGKRNRLE